MKGKAVKFSCMFGQIAICPRLGNMVPVLAMAPAVMVLPRELAVSETLIVNGLVAAVVLNIQVKVVLAPGAKL